MFFPGFAASKVIYGSPVRTNKELKEAVDLGLHLNLENEIEIDQGIARSGAFLGFSFPVRNKGELFQVLQKPLKIS